MKRWSRTRLKQSIGRGTKSFYHNVWFFPGILAIPLIVLSLLGISGSSIGTFHVLLYGSQKDPNLIINQPQPIRSDEWLVNTQMTISQAKNGFPRINPDLGNGEDVSLMADVPYKEWSELFRPQNLVYFIFPLSIAYALKWWIIAYLLIVSCYFFVLALLPKKRLWAALLSIAFFFSAFVQWWYTYGTLSPLYYSLFIATAVIYLSRQTMLWKKLTLTAIIAYLLACFALVLYPPFQISCGIVLATFLAGYCFEQFRTWGKRKSLQLVGMLALSGVIALAITGVFLTTRHDTVQSITHTAYPGKRSLSSGGVNIDHFLSSQLGHQFLSPQHASGYLIDNKNPTNQSEGSNFLLLAPFLFLPSVAMLVYDYRRKHRTDWLLLFGCALFVVFLFELFVPAFTPLSKLLLLNQVGSYRSLIGMGLLNLVVIVLFIRNLSRKQQPFPLKLTAAYATIVLAVELYINLHAHYSFGLFVGLSRALLYAIPIPLIIYLLLRKRFTLALIGYMAFALFIGGRVNPLYRGLTTLTNDQVSVAMRSVAGSSNKKWISDGGYQENMALINDLPSLSGVYMYPQLDLWDDIPGVQSKIYNRYAHVGFQFSNDPSTHTSLKLLGGDSFVVKTYVCSNYLKQQNVGFILTAAQLQNQCITLRKTVHYPSATLYIYSIN